MKITFDASGILAPLQQTKPKFYIAFIFLLAVMGVGAYAYFIQLREGLGTTGMNRPVFWGMYIGNFVFFASLALAGTLISAILRVLHVEWRKPITRAAETISIFALIFAVANIMVDMGRPDRLMSVIQHGRARSPILWDVISINGYLAAAAIYLYLPMVPDLALLRDQKIGRFQFLYKILALNYHHSPMQTRWHKRLIFFSAVLMIPLSVSESAVTAWLFATTVQPVWHSTIYAPFFVVGALYTGTAVLVLILALVRKALDLQHIIKDVHFSNLGLVLLAEGCFVAYFLTCMYMVEITGAEPLILKVVMSEIRGAFAVPFWLMITIGILFPPLLLAFRSGRSIQGVVTASIIIVVAMWVERYLIVVPTLTQPRLGWAEGFYHPTWIEWAVTASTMAAFALSILLFAKLFPMLSIWEIQDGIDTAVPDAKEKFENLAPAPKKEALQG